MHTAIVQNKSIACQADWFLLDQKKEKFSCPVFCTKATFYCKKRQPMCVAASDHTTDTMPSGLKKTRYIYIWIFRLKPE
jgi:hypothetical protein